MEKPRISILFNGILKENPCLVLLLGTCPTLAVTTLAVNGLGMGIAATAVLVFSNVLIALFKNIIPEKVRIPAYIVLIAGLVSIVQMLVQAYAPEVDKALGIFLPLIVVNCIILGRAEVFASKNSVLNAFLDGVGMGIGFTLALIFIGAIRELLGAGTIFGFEITSRFMDSMTVFLLPAGGFFIFGCTIALVNKVTKGRAIKRKTMGCAGCPSAGACGLAKE